MRFESGESQAPSQSSHYCWYEHVRRRAQRSVPGSSQGVPPPAYHNKRKEPCTNKQRAPTWQQAGRYCSATVEQSPLRSQAQQAWRSVLGSLLAQQASSALGPCQHVE